MMDRKYRNNLELNLKCDRSSKTICAHQYTTYPLRLSPVFRLDGVDTNRAYFYTMNTSPGLLAGDELNISLKLNPKTNLYLTDQAATKVHQMPNLDSQAMVNYQIELQPRANLEFLPEPIILYKNAALSQNITIQLDESAGLFLREIILPGRLARGEYYQFRHYFNRLTVTDSTNKLLFTDAMHLTGKTNLFKNSKLFSPLPIISNAIAVYPDLDLKLLSQKLADIQITHFPSLMLATSILPGECGILIRALASKTFTLKNYFNLALNCVRQLTNQCTLPYIPK